MRRDAAHASSSPATRRASSHPSVRASVSVISPSYVLVRLRPARRGPTRRRMVSSRDRFCARGPAPRDGGRDGVWSAGSRFPRGECARWRNRATGSARLCEAHCCSGSTSRGSACCAPRGPRRRALARATLGPKAGRARRSTSTPTGFRRPCKKVRRALRGIGLDEALGSRGGGVCGGRPGPLRADGGANLRGNRGALVRDLRDRARAQVLPTRTTTNLGDRDDQLPQFMSRTRCSAPTSCCPPPVPTFERHPSPARDRRQPAVSNGSAEDGTPASSTVSRDSVSRGGQGRRDRPRPHRDPAKARLRALSAVRPGGDPYTCARHALVVQIFA